MKLFKMNRLTTWQLIWSRPGRMRPVLMLTLALASGPTGITSAQSQSTPQDAPTITFRSSIDLVRVSAVVRDRKGRFVRDLSSKEFEIVDGGITRTIADFRQDDSGIALALLFDVSGSMEARMGAARDAALNVLAGLTSADDESGVFTFDTKLEEVRPFVAGTHVLPESMDALRPFGATSLHDAIARAAEKVAKRPSLRRAVVVFTDGRDTASRMTASEVSGLASSIDVPVYIVGIVPSIDNPLADRSATTMENSAFVSSLGNLAYWTGGDVLVASTALERASAARKLITELRHQYLIAFESSALPGWHPLQIKMRNKELTVRARSGYIAGQSRPISN
jgi:Ca-activated chloride channel family protein